MFCGLDSIGFSGFWGGEVKIVAIIWSIVRRWTSERVRDWMWDLNFELQLWFLSSTYRLKAKVIQKDLQLSVLKYGDGLKVIIESNWHGIKANTLLIFLWCILLNYGLIT